jgi:hypothetical protein
MRPRILITLGTLAVVGVTALALAATLAWPRPRPDRPWGGPVHAARAWLEAVRLGDGTSACELLDPMVLERVGGTIGACSLHFGTPHPMSFRIISVSRNGDVYAVAVATAQAIGTVQVELEGRTYRIVRASFDGDVLSA